MVDQDRRRVLKGVGAVGATILGAGCSSNGNNRGKEGNGTPTGKDTTDSDPANTEDDGEETTDDEPEINRPDNYRWDMIPGRNEELRNELGQYVEEPVGDVVENHPAFEYSTESERDDHEVDFEALKLFRDAQYDILKENDPSGISWEHYVEAFVNEELEQEAKTEGFKKQDTAAPSTYTTEAWLNAETVEDSLDLSHGLLEAMVPQQTVQPAEQGAILREAYKRHHNFDVLAWETNMGASNGSHNARITGLMYSPDDDKIRAHDISPPEEVGTGGTGVKASGKWHSEIQEWNVFDEGGELFHPLLFHTDEWNRQDPGFENAKTYALGTIHRIGGPNNDWTREQDAGNFTATTGLTEQLTRTVLNYNKNDASFEDLWNIASAMEYVNEQQGNYVFDTNVEDDNYEGIFDGGFAVYEVEDENVVDEVWADQAGEYDNFGQVYDKLENPA